MERGVEGSSKAFCASSIARKNNQNHLFVLSDKEDAAYFFNDLEALIIMINRFCFS